MPLLLSASAEWLIDEAVERELPRLYRTSIWSASSCRNSTLRFGKRTPLSYGVGHAEEFAACSFSGMRNPYDFAYNLAGEAFVFDSDMEWDVTAPAYLRGPRRCT